jgi:hypothetical protein
MQVLLSITIKSIIAFLFARGCVRRKWVRLNDTFANFFLIGGGFFAIYSGYSEYALYQELGGITDFSMAVQSLWLQLEFFSYLFPASIALLTMGYYNLPEKTKKNLETKHLITQSNDVNLSKSSEGEN